MTSTRSRERRSISDCIARRGRRLCLQRVEELLIQRRKVLWTCEELGLQFEREDWGGGFRSTSEPALRALNPVGRVPVIDDDGTIVWESNVIVRYLAARHGRADLLPTDPLQRAHVEQWMDWQASDFNNSWRVPFQALVRKNPDFQDERAIEKSAQPTYVNVDRYYGCLLERSGFRRYGRDGGP